MFLWILNPALAVQNILSLQYRSSSQTPLPSENFPTQNLLLRSTHMARLHQRSPSPSLADSPSQIKRIKTSHNGATGSNSVSSSSPIHPDADVAAQFTPEVFDHSIIAKLNTGYLNNEPFKYAVVEKLFQDDLLKKVKDECLSELNFTEKETDIYKVNFIKILPGLLSDTEPRSTKLAI